LVALKLRDEDFYKKIIGGECNATEIIEHLVTKHKGHELFGIDPETNKFVRGHGHALCAELYAISPKEWLWKVEEDTRDDADEHVHLSEKLFHPIVQEIYRMGRLQKKYFNSNEGLEFKRTIHHRIPINDFSKCIELVGFKDEAK